MTIHTFAQVARLILAVLFFSPLFGQVYAVRSFGVEWVVLADGIYQRTGSPLGFQKVQGLPALVPGQESASGPLIFDGERLYEANTSTGKGFRIRTAEAIQQEHRSVWFWMPPMVIPREDCRLLAVAGGSLLLGIRDVKGTHGSAVYRVERMAWPSQNRWTLIEWPDSHRNLQVVALASEGRFYIFTSGGSLYEAEWESGSVTLLEDGLFMRLCPGFIDSVMVPGAGGKRLPQPPTFLGPPFCSPSGEVFVASQVRQRNRHSEAAIRRAFDSLPVKEQQRLVDAGNWPIKEEDYLGSDYVAMMLRFDPTTRKLDAVTPEDLGSLVRQHPETGQWRWATGGSMSLTVDEQGRFVLLNQQATPDPTPQGGAIAPKP